MDIGKAIKNFRASRGLNQGEFAEMVHVTQTSLSLIENGKSKPNIELLERISYEFKIPVEVFFFNALTREQVPVNKRELFDSMKPAIDLMINSLFSDGN